jgi:hypothetical protein
MTDENLTITFTVDQTPEQVFAAVSDVRAWWSGAIVGGTDQLGDEFTYTYQELHYTKQRVTELVPGKKVCWLVLESSINFVADKDEWTGTRVVFEIANKGAQTELRFTHVGLSPERECFDACSKGWNFYISGSLRRLIETGKGAPNDELPSAEPASARAQGAQLS